MKVRKCILAGAILGTAALIGLTASAQVLFTTQNDFTGWSAVDAGISATTGVTGDSDFSAINGAGNATAAGGAGAPGALQISQTAGGYKQTASYQENQNAGFISAVANNHTISLDYTLSNDVLKTGNEYYQLWLVFNFTG